RAPVAIVAQIDNPNSAGTNARGEVLSKLRTLLEDVRFYEQHRAEYDRGAMRSLSATKADLEALIPVVEGQLPLLLEANRVDEIDSALVLARDYNLKLMIVGGAEAWLNVAKPVEAGGFEGRAFRRGSFARCAEWQAASNCAGDHRNAL